MDKELAHKRPADVVRAAPLPLQVSRVQMTHRPDLERQIGRMIQEGRILPEYRVVRRGNHWEGHVTFLPSQSRRRSSRRLPVTLAMVLAALGGLVILIKMLVAALLALVPFLLGLAALLALVVVGVSVSSGSGVSITQIVNYRR